MPKKQKHEQDDSILRLRPHHLLCTQGYEGKGYNQEFVRNMTVIVSRLRNEDSTPIKLVFTTDSICDKCPKKVAAGICEKDLKVKMMDKKVMDCFNLEEDNYSYQEVIKKINKGMTAAMLDDICNDCSWFLESACRQNIIG
ncbi:MAG: DUF1284 domain-containing protein [Coriobacteriia bacterium]|nr:DUF1284 domain-containing protein [Coriobacteriia bacterium]MCL2746654.1 DUF1284 domain-containing protein [Coriobacteriia bacterium]MCL2870955.1 DUF1284 domain-containing protein [Coriobacteriia bacterium]